MMTSLHTYQLLLKAAHQSQDQLEISPKDIEKKIEHLKYLSAQKKVPKLSIRKEILELEQQLHKVTALEKKMQTMKRRESSKISALKEQNARLKRQLVATKHFGMHKKVSKLSHLLGESLAKHEVSKEVTLDKRMIKKARKKKQRPLQKLDQQLETLREKFQQLKEKEDNPEKIARVGQLITLLEGKLDVLQEKGVGFRKGKHTLMFHPLEKSVIKRFDQELPLPPPPRMN